MTKTHIDKIMTRAGMGYMSMDDILVLVAEIIRLNEALSFYAELDKCTPGLVSYRAKDALE